MINIQMSDYIKYSIQKEYPLELAWVLTLFSVLKSTFDTEYFSFDKKDVILKTDTEDLYTTDNIKNKIPLLDFTDKITIDKSFLVNVNTKTETTIGKLILNYLIGTYCFNNKIPYINETFTFSVVEDYIQPLLGIKDETGITVAEYKKFLDMRLYIDTFANYYSVGVTEYSLKPAPGILEYKNKIVKELKKEYGDDSLKDLMVFKKLEDKLIAYDVEYLKKDISFGKIVNKKVIETSRKRMYGAFGSSTSLDGTNEPILSDLASGIKKDKKEIASQFNNIRYGSFARGSETKDMGVLTKFLIRATSDVIIDEKDCKTKICLKVKIEDDKTFLNRYILDKNILTLLTKDNIGKYLNKEVSLRDPIFCQSDEGVCINCIGEDFRGHQDEIPLLATGIGGTFLSASLKKFHGLDIKLTRLPESLFI